jgi:hypothetical protein
MERPESGADTVRWPVAALTDPADAVRCCWGWTW